MKKFLYYFRGGFSAAKYISWERDYKWQAHLAWMGKLNEKEYRRLLDEKEYAEIARRAIWLESRTNLLFSFEKMALRDAVKTDESSRAFAEGLFEYIYGKQKIRQRFDAFVKVLAGLPKKQTRVLTWPLLTVFGFIADPSQHIFLKPRVTQVAAVKYDFPFAYHSKPNWETYESLLEFAEQVKSDISRLKPQDMIDIQSFIWVLGSEEYPD